MNAEAKTQLTEATIRQWTWKTPAMRQMTLAVCRLALGAEGGGRRAEDGGRKTEDGDQKTEGGGQTDSTPNSHLPASDFSANDLPEFEHGGSGICGAVFHRLVADGVLTAVGTFNGTEFCPKVVRNAGGNLIRVYRLRNGALARRVLELHGGHRAERYAEQELALV